jgi:Rrf2 family protein
MASLDLSLRSEYAIKAAVRLALSYGNGPVRARDIAEFGGIPPKFVEQVMHDLRQAGLVSSRRGKSGGYELARNPTLVRLAQVVEAVEGPLEETPPLSPGDEAGRFVQPVWERVRQAAWSVLWSMSLGDAAARAPATPMYYI